jgi:hypothetical protein
MTFAKDQHASYTCHTFHKVLFFSNEMNRVYCQQQTILKLTVWAVDCRLGPPWPSEMNWSGPEVKCLISVEGAIMT